MQRLHVLQLAGSSAWRGEMEHVFSLSRALLDFGCRVTLAYREMKRGRKLTLAVEAAGDYGITDLLPLNLDSGLHPLQIMSDRGALLRYMQSDPVDVIHSHRGQDHWLAAAALLGKTDPPLIRTRHVVTPVKSHAANRRLFSRTRFIIATSNACREELLKSGTAPPEKIVVLHGGVDTKRFNVDVEGSGFRREVGIGPGGLLIGAVGHVDPVKGYEYLIEACGLLRKEFSPFRLVIVGQEGKTKIEALKKSAERLGISDKLIFTGFRKDIPSIVSALDIGVISSIGSEGNSRTALEMAACGKPIVSTTVGCLPDVFQDGVDGLLVPPRDPTAVKNALLDLCKNEEMRRALGKAAALKISDRYSWPMVAAKIVDIYRSSIDRPERL